MALQEAGTWSALGEGMRTVGGMASCSRALGGRLRGHKPARVCRVQPSVPKKRPVKTQVDLG